MFQFASIPKPEDKPVEKDSPHSNAESETIKAEATPEAPKVTKDVDETDTEAVQIQPPSQDDNSVLICKHPRYEQYFRLMSIGVLKAALKSKMTQEGLDPELLE